MFSRLLQQSPTGLLESLAGLRASPHQMMGASPSRLVLSSVARLSPTVFDTEGVGGSKLGGLGGLGPLPLSPLDIRLPAVTDPAHAHPACLGEASVPKGTEATTPSVAATPTATIAAAAAIPTATVLSDPFDPARHNPAAVPGPLASVTGPLPLSEPLMASADTGLTVG